MACFLWTIFLGALRGPIFMYFLVKYPGIHEAFLGARRAPIFTRSSHPRSPVFPGHQIRAVVSIPCYGIKIQF
jgi:hypothetical protein